MKVSSIIFVLLLTALFGMNLGFIKGIKATFVFQQTQIDNLQTEVDNLKQQIKTNHEKVIISAYHPKSKGINSDNTPDSTATMVKPISGWTLALSSELIEQGWLGKKIYIDGWGVGKATDRMHTKIKGKRIDICHPTLASAKKFGVKDDVLAIVLE